jgi:molybdate transport system substrate-binding protein
MPTPDIRLEPALTATATSLNLLCAGAAQGLVKALSAEFQKQTGATVEARFGAVGAQKEALLSGAPCDLMIVTASMVDALIASGHLQAGSRADLGCVRTGVAVRQGSEHADVSTPAALEVALRDADAIYFPDPDRATAGIHFVSVMQRLGVLEGLRPRFRTFASGAIAMRELAASGAARPIGCTQVSEILYTDGVALCGPLPAGFELSTTYTGAVSHHAASPHLARAMLTLLTAEGSRALREAGGFET